MTEEQERLVAAIVPEGWLWAEWKGRVMMWPTDGYKPTLHEEKIIINELKTIFGG